MKILRSIKLPWYVWAIIVVMSAALVAFFITDGKGFVGFMAQKIIKAGFIGGVIGGIFGGLRAAIFVLSNKISSRGTKKESGDALSDDEGGAPKK